MLVTKRKVALQRLVGLLIMTENLKLPLPDVLSSNLYLIKQNLKESSIDWVHLCVGDEGVGKTDFSVLLCQTVDPAFDAPQVAYSFEQLQQIIDDFGDETLGRAILLDEGGEVLFARDWMRKENREMIKLFMRIRKKRLFFVVNIPRLDIDKKFEGRVKTLSQCSFDITERGILKQGRFKFYGYQKTREIFAKRKFPKPNFSGHFGKVEQGLWERIQAKNFAFLNGADANSLARVRALNKHQLDRDVLKVVNDLMAGLQVGRFHSTEVLEALKGKYGNVLSPQIVGSVLKGFGFKRYRDAHKDKAFLIDKAVVDELVKTFDAGQKRAKKDKNMNN